MAFLNLQVPAMTYKILNTHGRLLGVLNNNFFVFFHLTLMIIY